MVAKRLDLLGPGGLHPVGFQCVTVDIEVQPPLFTSATVIEDPTCVSVFFLRGNCPDGAWGYDAIGLQLVP